jgi:hypothetical protein
LSVVAFSATQSRLRPRPVSVRILWLVGFSLLSIPSLWFAIYYLHVLREYEWFYTLRSWRGSEFLVVFLGCAAGAAAALLPRVLLTLPLSALLALAMVPYIKPLIGPLPDDLFREQGQGHVCLQSTPSTCGPASVTTIIRHLGLPASERTTARAAFSYAGGTEAWYLARYVRARGLSPHFDFRRTFSPAAGLPALVGVRVDSLGHFIAVLELRDDQITFVDPLHGEERLSLTEFQRRYKFTGFHMVIKRA